MRSSCAASFSKYEAKATIGKQHTKPRITPLQTARSAINLVDHPARGKGNAHGDSPTSDNVIVRADRGQPTEEDAEDGAHDHADRAKGHERHSEATPQTATQASLRVGISSRHSRHNRRRIEHVSITCKRWTT